MNVDYFCNSVSLFDCFLSAALLLIKRISFTIINWGMPNSFWGFWSPKKGRKV